MKIYNMDIGFDGYWFDLPDERQAVLDGIYAMMDQDRGAKHPFDVILSGLSYDGLQTVTLTATQVCRIDFEELHTETVSFTLKELFG